MRIKKGSETLKLPASVNARSLLAYLLIHKNESHSRLTLVGSLWPEKQESLALRTLSQALWQIKKTFPEIVGADRQLIWNENSSIWVDVEVFQQITKADLPQLRHSKTNRGLQPGNVTTRSSIQQAVDIYTGELLEGFFDEWVLILREQLRETYLQTLELAINLEKKGGNFGDALSYGKLLVEEDPLREEAHCELMRLHMALEQPQAAMKRFEICRQILRTELNTEPDEKTKKLAEEISQRISMASMFEKQTESDSAPEAAETTFVQKLPLIGREKERRILLENIDGMFNGEGCVVLVEGEAGVGKTRLMEEISIDIEWRGGQVLTGRGREMEIIPPFGPLVETLSSSLSPLRASQLCKLVAKPWLQVLKPLIPELAKVKPELLPAPPLDSDQDQTRLLEAIVHFLKEWCKITPLVLVLEDLHWFDKDTLDLLPSLVSRVNEIGLLLIITYRGEEARAYPALWEKLQEIDALGKHQRLPLSRLTAAATGELIRRYLGIDREAPIFETRLYQETEGNPLFVLETLRALIDEGLLLRDRSGGWSTPWDETTVDYAELPLPKVVEQVISRRLNRITPEMRQLLYVAAVLGNHFDFDWLTSSTGMEMGTLLKIAGDLVRRHFWIETPQEYSFIHEKIRQVTYQAIPTGERESLHCQAGEALENLHPNRYSNLSYHFYEGHAWEKAARYSRLAGDQAVSIYANKEALALYDQALECLEKSSITPEPARIFKIRMARESIYARTGLREMQSEELKTIETLAAHSGDNEKETHRNQALVALRQAQYAEAIGDSQGSMSAAQTTINHAKLANDVKTEAAGYLELGVGLWRQGEYQASQPKLEQALDLARSAGSGRLEADSLRNLGNVCWFLGDYAEAIELYKKTLAVCRRIGDSLGEARTLNNLGVLSEHQGKFSQARKHLMQSIQIHNEIGDRRGESNTLANLANIDLNQGEFLRAKENYELALPIRQSVGDREGEAIVLVNLGIVWNQLGDYTKSGQYFNNSLDIFQELDNRWGAGYVLGFLGLRAHQMDDNETALDFCQRASEAAEELDIAEHLGQALTFLGHALTALNRLDEAIKAYDKALALRVELGHPHIVAETQSGLARLFLARDDLPKAQEHIEAVLKHLETGSLDGTDEPIRIYLTCYKTLIANNDSRADTILTTTYNILQDRAAKIEETTIRRSFLENITAHREILAAYNLLQKQKVTVRLPAIEAPAGRPLHDDELVNVTWTVHALEDKAIRKKSGLRQRRLQRLLEEASSQGAAPTIGDLASTLEVSPATIKRDLADLRQKGIRVETRGSRGISKNEPKV